MLVFVLAAMWASPLFSQGDTTAPAQDKTDTLFYSVNEVPGAYVTDKVWLEGVTRSLLPMHRKVQ